VDGGGRLHFMILKEESEMFNEKIGWGSVIGRPFMKHIWKDQGTIDAIVKSM